MRKDKDQAMELRKLGKSYSEIKRELGVPISTLSGWLAGEAWSQNVKNSLNSATRAVNSDRMWRLNKARGKHLKRLYESARNEAESDFERLKYHPLFISALMLYWGEGRKAKSSNVSLANTDPRMIKVFGHFLRDICQIPQAKIRFSLLIYPDIDDAECRVFWARETGIPLENFWESTIIQGRHKTKRVHQGIGIICVSSKYLHCKMLTWLELMPNTLLDQKYYINADIV